ncbi:MAG: hypothetical protein ACR2LR_16505 [Hassallia sp.]
MTNYIEKDPLRTKQILGISYNQYQSLLTQAIAHHQEKELSDEYLSNT